MKEEQKLELAWEQEAFPQLPALAARLGVKPNTGSGNLKMAMKDGTLYDVFELVNALLDKIERCVCYGD